MKTLVLRQRALIGLCGTYTAQMNQAVHSIQPSKSALKKAVGAAPGRTNDPARTMAGILEVATAEFAAKGLAGARIDAIADATHTSKRMIYYYFGSKEGLYIRVLEDSYRRMRSIESEQSLDDLPPEEALRKLVGFTFDHHQGNQDYIRLVMTENMARGAYLAQSTTVQRLNAQAILAISRLYDRGVSQGLFRAGLDPVDIHASISALAFFNVSNRYTFDQIFKRDGQSPEALAARRANVVEMLVRFVRK